MYLRCNLIYMKIGILGGGQLGRMLLQASGNYVVETHVLEKDPSCPAAAFCDRFTAGDITSYEDVYRFGKGLDAITIEIERVNTDALEALQKEGVQVYPSPTAIRLFQDKRQQKDFYRRHEIPTADYRITTDLADLAAQADFLPAVHKIGIGGYDGKGVRVLRDKNDLPNGFDDGAVLEKMVDVKTEIALIVAMDTRGKTALYPPAEMVFDPIRNVLDYQVSPALLPEKMLWRAEAMAIRLVQELKSPGLFAVELFIDAGGNVLVNETAPRVHNSGHHTIEGNYSSQYDMLWRIMLGYPLGNTSPILPAAMVNILGETGASGEVVYEGLTDTLALDNVFVHLYGKKQTAPGRKMGHVTILSSDYAELRHQANKIRHLLRATTL